MGPGQHGPAPFGCIAVGQEQRRVRPGIRSEVDSTDHRGGGNIEQHDVTSAVVIRPVLRGQRTPAVGRDVDLMGNHRTDRDTGDLETGGQIDERDAATRAIRDEKGSLLRYGRRGDGQREQQYRYGAWSWLERHG